MARKNNLPYLLLFMLILATGCAKTPQDDPAIYPLGTFGGQFLLLNKKTSSPGYDTVKANLQLVLSTTTGYAVTGDTVRLHAGSYGSFYEDRTYIAFGDLTYPMKTPTKIHLSGSYKYIYDGTRLLFGKTNPDSVVYLYDLKRITN
jgi:hypothetical protein